MTKDQERFLDMLVERHGPSMLQLARRFTGDAKLAEDVVQDTLLIACKKINTLYRHDCPAGWLFKTLNNVIKRENKRAYHQREIPLEDWILTVQESDSSIREFLPSGLSEREEDLLVWRLEEELTYEDIAARLGITPVACRQQVCRTIRKCKNLIK